MTSTCPIGTAAEVTGPEAAREVGAATSLTVLHAWHSPQRPTHLAVSQPHSVQR